MYRIIYAGDSTAARNSFATWPQCGLSQGILWYLKDDVFVRSFAVNGRSTKSFIDEGRLKEIEGCIAPGDLFFIGFGHNDEKQQDPLRYADPFGAYKDNLKEFIRVGREHGAPPLIITPVARRLFDGDGHFLPGSHGDYPRAAIEAASEEAVPFIDLDSKSEKLLSAMGDLASRELYVYPKDNSHMTIRGAVVMAGLLAEELKKLGAPFSDVLCDAAVASPADYHSAEKEE